MWLRFFVWLVGLVWFVVVWPVPGICPQSMSTALDFGGNCPQSMSTGADLAGICP
ncbi:hypothetical protein [Lactobacillus equicursoris]|uniref:hypothetical protein n=1 Tax=Lactobacillus equicursoris TaxID=420645 RepID=UPI003990F152